MAHLQVSIVTPDGAILSDEYDMVSCRSTMGELGILPNHIPIVAPLAISAIRLQKNNEVDKVAVTGGFLELSNNEMTILATAAEREGEIDIRRAEEAKERAERRLASQQATVDFARAELALKRAINRIQVSKH